MITTAAAAGGEAGGGCSADALLQTFLRYQTPEVISEKELAILSDNNNNEGRGAWTSITAAKLAAAKNASRETFLASQGVSLARTTPAAGNAKRKVPPASVRKDPSMARYPTPPVAGRRRAAGRPHLTTAARSTGEAAAAGTTAASFAAHGTSAAPEDAEAAASRQDMLPSLMRNLRDPTQVLYSIFPPSLVTLPETGEHAVQRVSTALSTRADVAQLHNDVKRRLEARRARPAGVCHIRREIYDDLFSELIRQVALEEPARGVLLQRVRDELNHSLSVHQDLLAGAEYFASRKLLTCRAGMDKLEKKTEELEREKQRIEQQKHALEDRRQALEKRIEEEGQQRNLNNQEELNYLRRANQQLSLRLKAETERASAAGGAAVSLDPFPATSAE